MGDLFSLYCSQDEVKHNIQFVGGVHAADVHLPQLPCPAVPQRRPPSATTPQATPWWIQQQLQQWLQQWLQQQAWWYPAFQRCRTCRSGSRVWSCFSLWKMNSQEM